MQRQVELVALLLYQCQYNISHHKVITVFTITLGNGKKYDTLTEVAKLVVLLIL